MSDRLYRRKFTAKKHKTWDGDGILTVSDGYASLLDVSGKDMGKTMWDSPLLPGSTLSIGGKEVEIDSLLEKDRLPSLRQLPDVTKITDPRPQQVNKAVTKPEKRAELHAVERVAIAPQSKATNSRFRNPLLSSTVMPRENTQAPQPRHDPSQPGALVMKRPALVPKGKQIVDVVVDPILTRHLRDHQREGVKFMYECVMGMRSFEGEGAILADEMGLGKTLQTIALLWTLLKQNPIHEAPPIIKKALVVCPVTLINNWRKEFKKWLGNERIGVFVADGAKTRLTDFTMGRSYSVMIIGYEKLRTVQEDLKKGGGIDIVIADEGHRLKTAQNKSAQAIKSLNTEKRIILSGTPLQNDLSELYTMVDFVNPGLLGKYTKFKRDFEAPIVKSRQPQAPSKDIEKGEMQSEALASLTGMFILRRTAEILSKYLPPKTECVLFCRPTKAQASVYREVLSSPLFSAALGNSEVSLQLITILKKLCNSPTLLNAKNTEKSNETTQSLLSGVSSASLQSPGASGKIQVLDSLLHRLRTSTTEKVVLVSNYTSTLDVLGNLLNSLSYSYLRLDGTTPASKRQSLVDRFNRSDARTCFAFLLSARAGGTGLNLTGASRLVLFDIDWNPSTDAQAMARIHRDGQKRPCWIYRLVTQGALEEKIYQRQLTKQGLADSVIDNKASVSSFSREELRDLFSLDESGDCMTHRLLGCACEGSGELPDFDVSEEEGPAAVANLTDNDDCDNDDDLPEPETLLKASEVDMEAQERRIREQARSKASKQKMLTLMQYSHFDTQRILTMEEEDAEVAVRDGILRDMLRESGNRVSFVFSKISA